MMDMCACIVYFFRVRLHVLRYVRPQHAQVKGVDEED